MTCAAQLKTKKSLIVIFACIPVECIRAQRAFSIQMPDQYVFCHLAFLEYVLNMGYAEEIDLTGFDEETSLQE